MTDNIQFHWSNGDEKRTIFLDDFLAALNKWVNEYETKNYPGLEPSTIVAKPGRKYIKLITIGRNCSVYCFIDRNGNIYKAASWKAPAKHIRGSIFDANYSLGKALGHYGAAYLK